MKSLTILLISLSIIGLSKCACCGKCGGGHNGSDSEPKLRVYTTRVTLEYPDWIQAPKNQRLNFKVRATHITLNFAPVPLNEFPNIEIGLDHFDYATCRTWRDNVDVMSSHSTKFLNGNKLLGFWASWKDGLIQIGLEGSEAPFQQWKDPIPFPINFVGFHTSQGKPGVWILEE